MCEERYDLLALIPAQGSVGMETDLADEELAKQMSVEVQIIIHLATKSREDRYVLCSRKSEKGTNSEKVH